MAFEVNHMRVRGKTHFVRKRDSGNEAPVLDPTDVPLSQILHYKFDNFMVNSYAIFVLVSIAAIITVLFGGLFLLAGGTSIQKSLMSISKFQIA